MYFEESMCKKNKDTVARDQLQFRCELPKIFTVTKESTLSKKMYMDSHFVPLPSAFADKSLFENSSSARQNSLQNLTASLNT